MTHKNCWNNLFLKNFILFTLKGNFSARRISLFTVIYKLFRCSFQAESAYYVVAAGVKYIKSQSFHLNYTVIPIIPSTEIFCCRCYSLKRCFPCWPSRATGIMDAVTFRYKLKLQGKGLWIPENVETSLSHHFPSRLRKVESVTL